MQSQAKKIEVERIEAARLSRRASGATSGMKTRRIISLC